MLLSLYPSLATISSKSHLGQISLAPIRQDPSRSSSVQAKDPRASIVPQAPIKTSSSQATIKTHEPQSSTDQNPQAPVKHRSRPTSSDQAPVKTHVLRSSTDQNPRASICLSVGLSVWACLCVGVDVFVCVHLRKKKMRRGKLNSLVVHGEKRKKKVRTEINIITNAHATVILHICTVTVTIMHKCTIMYKLVWVFFLLKLCKSS